MIASQAVEMARKGPFRPVVASGVNVVEGNRRGAQVALGEGLNKAAIDKHNCPRDRTTLVMTACRYYFYGISQDGGQPRDQPRYLAKRNPAPPPIVTKLWIMATGLEVGAAAAGFFSLAMQCFNGCIQAYELIRTARNMEHESDAVRSRLLWQERRLLDWRDRIETGPNMSKDKLDWGLVRSLLEEQCEHLTSAAKLRAKYKLNIDEEEIDMAQVENNDTDQSTLGKILARIEQRSPEKNNKPAFTMTATFRSVQWAAIGRTKAFRIIDDISEMNDRLHILLDSRDREWTKMVHEALLRRLISTSETAMELDVVQLLLQQQEPRIDSRIAAAAELKHYMSIVIDKKPNKSKPQLELTCIKNRKLRPLGKPLLADSGLVMASYRKEQVLIEWRSTDSEDWEIMKSPMQDLAALLTTMDREVFPVLPFKGLVRDKTNRFALVYELPPGMTDQYPELKVSSLHQIIREGYKVSLTCRLAIALRLAEALLQFHTAGWLHKGIRSENVIFVSPSSATAEELLEGDAYLVGFEHARPDSEMGKSLTRLPTTSLGADLYRHPKARGVDRQPFEKSFDIYALGCVLLELARCETLVDIHPDSGGLDEAIRSAEDSGRAMQLPSIEDWGSLPGEVSAVAYAAGKAFAEVVALCFNSDANQKRSSTLELQQEVVNKLRSCRF